MSSNLLGHPVVKSQIILNAIMKLIFHLPYRSHNSNCKLGNTVHCENDMSHFHDMTWSKKTPDSIFPNSFVSKGKL